MSVDFYTAILNFARATCTECFAERQQSLQISSYISQYFVYLHTKTETTTTTATTAAVAAAKLTKTANRKFQCDWCEQRRALVERNRNMKRKLSVLLFLLHTNTFTRTHTRCQLRSVLSSLYELAKLINIRFGDKLNLTCDSDVYENELNQIRKSYEMK